MQENYNETNNNNNENQIIEDENNSQNIIEKPEYYKNTNTINKLDTFLLISIHYVPFLFFFGSGCLILGGLSSDPTFALTVCYLCYGFSALVVILSVITGIKKIIKDIKENGFNLGKTPEEKIFSFICIIIIIIILIKLYLLFK